MCQFSSLAAKPHIALLWQLVRSWACRLSLSSFLYVDIFWIGGSLSFWWKYLIWILSVSINKISPIISCEIAARLGNWSRLGSKSFHISLCVLFIFYTLFSWLIARPGQPDVYGKLLERSNLKFLLKNVSLVLKDHGCQSTNDWPQLRMLLVDVEKRSRTKWKYPILEN